MKIDVAISSAQFLHVGGGVTIIVAGCAVRIYRGHVLRA